MAVVVVLIGLVAAALLVNWVCARAADRLADRISRPDGTGFDVSVVRPKIQALREDFATESHLRRQDSLSHEELIQNARRAISRMAFFQSRPQQPPPKDHFEMA
jgi:hypothetical protein